MSGRAIEAHFCEVIPITQIRVQFGEEISLLANVEEDVVGLLPDSS